MASGASVSSFGSGLDPDEAKDSKLAGGDDSENVDIDGTKASAVHGIFGVLYTVTKEKDTNSFGFVVFKLVADFLQLFLLLVSPMYGYDIKYNSKGWQITNFIGLNQFIAARGYTFFLILLYVFVVMLLLVCATCFWVAWSFQNNRFDHVWPIIFLKIFSNVFFQVLDVASLSLFLITLDCNYFDVRDGTRYLNNEFPSVQCWAMPHVIHVIVSAASLILFCFLASLVNMAEIELNPISKNPMAMGHSKVELVGFLLRMGITMVNTFVTNRKWMSIIQLMLSWALVWQYTVWIPHMTSVMNYLRSATYAATCYCALLTVFISFKPGVEQDDAEAVYQFERKVTVALWAGMPFAATVGAAAAWARTYYFGEMVLKRFRDARQGTKPADIYKFTDPREVEIVARCCRKWVDDDTVDAEAMKLAELVIKAGLTELPGEAYMVILYSSFLIDVHGSYQSGYSQLEAAKKLKASLLEDFAVFSRKQQHTQKSSGGKGGAAHDLVSYVEFQRNYRVAMLAHREALLAERAFWRCLLNQTVTFTTLSKAVVRIDNAVNNAERVYRTVLQMHQSSWKLLKMYARFLEMVKNDPWSAVKWSSEADVLQQAEEEAKNDVFGELERNAGDDDDEGVKKAKEIRAQMEDSRAVIIINAKGEITLTNQGACDVFGYAKNELRGKNIKAIIPSPFSDHHDSYLRKYAVTGKANILGLTREFVAMHKERYVLAVILTVSQISGSGEDANFMGVIEPIPSPENTAKAWFMTSGAIVSADAHFQDWFGYRTEDLLGTFVSSLVVEHKQLSEFLRSIKNGDQQEEGSGKAGVEKEWEIDGLHIKHKFTESVAVDMSIRPGGAGSHSFYVMSVRRLNTRNTHMLVADTRGRIQHCTFELAQILGHTPHSIQQSGAANAVENLMPQPFAQLHRAHLADGPTPLAGPHTCISGITVCLKGVGPDGPELQPFKLKLQRRDEMGNTQHVVMCNKTTFAEALDERRLSVLVDPSGIIASVSHSPATLFNMEPTSMVGQPISRYIDGLRPGGGRPSMNGGDSLPKDPKLRAMAQETDAQELAHLLLQLAKRSSEAPGSSWRVGVVAPMDAKDVESLGILAEHFMQQRTKPAVMTVAVRVSGALAHRRSSMVSVAQLAGAMGSQGHSGSGNRSGANGSENRSNLPKRASSLMMEICLWRSELLTGIMEVDPRGKIVNVSEHQLCPPGLLFGVPNDKLLNKHVSRLLPLGDRPVSDLFEADFGASGAAMRSKLKKPTKPVDGRNRKPGKANVVGTQHFTDFGPLELQVQAVYKWGQGGHLYLVMHALRPRMAAPNFRDIISQDGPATGAAADSRSLNRLLSQAGSFVSMKSLVRPHALSAPVLDSAGEISALSAAPQPPGQPQGPKGVRMAPGLISGPTGKAAVAAAAAAAAGQQGQLLLQGRPAQAAEGGMFKGGAMLPPAPGSNDPADELLKELTGRGSGGLGKAAEKYGSGSIRERPSKNDSAMVNGGVPMSTQSMNAIDLHLVDNSTRFHLDSGSGLDARLSLAEQGVATEHEPEGEAAGYQQEEQEQEAALQQQQQTQLKAFDVASQSEDEMRSFEGDNSEEGVTGGASKSRGDANENTDFRRGQRYKKLLRLLAAANGAKVMRSFKLQTIAVIGAICLTHIATFIAMLLLVTHQKAQVVNLNGIGYTARAVAEVMVATRAVEIVLSGLTQPHLMRLNDSSTALQAQLDELWDCAHRFMAGHSATYLGFDSSSRLTSSLSVSALWDSPINNVVVFSTTPGGNVTRAVQQASLWDIGNSYAKAALNVWQNAANYSSNNSVAMDVVIDFHYILENGPDILNSGYTQTLDAYVDVVIDRSAVINNAQMIIMAVEGCLVTTLAVAYMWYLSARVSYHRHTLYNVFMLIPIGLIRGLASKEVIVEEQDAALAAASKASDQGMEAEEEDKADAGTKEQPAAAAIKFNAFGLANLQAQGLVGSWKTRVLNTVMFWRKNNQVTPAGSKRTLLKSYATAVWLTWPFVAWGVMIVIINAVGHQDMTGIGTAIAIFNMINFVNIRYHRVMFFMQELCRDTDSVTREAKRADMLYRYHLIDTEYKAMLFGHQAVPEQTSAHYVRATDGLITYGGAATELLFYTGGCLAEFDEDCQPVDSKYYELTRNGIDFMVKHGLEMMKQAHYSAGDYPNLGSDEYAYIWNTFPNVEGGLADANRLVEQAVNAVYESVVRVHVVAFVLTFLIMGGYLIVILRRYLSETKGETKRIAELLTQLGADVDMEGMLKAVLFSGNQPQPHKRRSSTSDMTGQSTTDDETESSNLKRSGGGDPPGHPQGTWPPNGPPMYPPNGFPPSGGKAMAAMPAPHMNGMMMGNMGWGAASRPTGMNGNGLMTIPEQATKGMTGTAMGDSMAITNGMHGMKGVRIGDYGIKGAKTGGHGMQGMKREGRGMKGAKAAKSHGPGGRGGA